MAFGACMIKVPYAEIIAKIQEQTSLSESQVQEKISEKLEQLSGLISRDGAAHIVANELGVKLILQGEKAQVKDIQVGQRSVTVVGRVTHVFDVREFKRGDESTGKVGNFMLGDETGQVRIVCWGNTTEVFPHLIENGIVKVENGLVRENRGFKEIHLNESSKIVLDPEGEVVGEVKKRDESQMRTIKQLQENEENASILGTVVQVFDPKFFEVCPQCGKRAKKEEDAFSCEQHGIVTPNYSYVANVFLDDGTESIRCVLFRNQLERLLGKTSEQMLMFKDDPYQFDSVKNDLLGQIIKVTGRVKRNEFFDRLEFISQLIIPNPSDDDIKRAQALHQQQ